MSKKQGKTKKNVFGLVSKIGSFIKKGGSNQDNTQSSGRSGDQTENETPRKNFNIHISEDNQEIFAIGDDDEEEEEDDYEEDESNEKDTKEKNDENISKDNNKQKITNTKEQNEINNEIKNEIKDKIDKKESIKEEKKEEDDIQNEKNIIIEEENIKDLKNNANSNTAEESEKIINNVKEKQENNNKINIEEENKDEENILYNNIISTCHFYLKKGNDFNSNDIFCFPVLKNTKKKSVFQKIGFFKKPKYDLLNYKLFIDENLIYLAKDIIIDKTNIYKRRISNVYKVKNIINYSSSKGENNNYHIYIEIINKNGILKDKEFFIEEKYFSFFNEEIKKSLKLYGGMYMKNK